MVQRLFSKNEKARAKRELARMREQDAEKLEELLVDAGKLAPPEKARRDQLRLVARGIGQP